MNHNKIAHRIATASKDMWDNISFEQDLGNDLLTIKVQYENPMSLDGYDPMENPTWDFGQVGNFVAVKEPRSLFDDDCIYDVGTLERKIGREVFLWRVGFVKISPSIRGIGIGSELYVRAAKAIARYDGVLVPDRCMTGGQTSGAADRVWQSHGVRQQLEVIGENVFWGGGQ